MIASTILLFSLIIFWCRINKNNWWQCSLLHDASLSWVHISQIISGDSLIFFLAKIMETLILGHLCYRFQDVKSYFCYRSLILIWRIHFLLKAAMLQLSIVLKLVVSIFNIRKSKRCLNLMWVQNPISLQPYQFTRIVQQQTH